MSIQRLSWVYGCLLSFLFLTSCYERDKRLGGDECKKDSVCLSGVCENGKCTEPEEDIEDPSWKVDIEAPEQDVSEPLTGCDEDPGGFGCACGENTHCNSGYCILTSSGEKRCTDYCRSECPEGWTCSYVQGGSDTAYICVEANSDLCRPCTSHSQCQGVLGGDTESRCVNFGEEEGSFCGVACGLYDDSCPEGYSCEDVKTVDEGQSVRQCVPNSGLDCECTGLASAQGAATACVFEGCPGVRTCSSSGLSACVVDDPECLIKTPAPPVILEVAPESPSQDLKPVVTGQALPSSDIEIFDNENCEGEALGSSRSSSSGAFSVEVEVAPDSETVFYGKLQNESGESSACGEGSRPYVNDRTPPLAPLLTGTLPASPSTSVLNPMILGELAEFEPNLKVRLYFGENCDGAPFETLEPAPENSPERGQFSTRILVTMHSMTQIVADTIDLAGNVSSCAEPIVYVVSDHVPETPVITASVPASPSNESTSPLLEGQTEAETTVSIYADSLCRGEVLGSVYSQDGSFAIEVEAKANDTVQFYAQARDQMGYTSLCSEAFSYTHNSFVPSPPILTGTDPESPSIDQLEVRILGTVSFGPQLSIVFFEGEGCIGEELGRVEVLHTSFEFSFLVEENTTTYFSAHTLNAEGDASACSNSISFSHDNLPPAVPVFLGSDPASPSSDDAPILFGETEAEAMVTIFRGNSCEFGEFVAEIQADDEGNFSVALPVELETANEFVAFASDAAGNTSACTEESFDYLHDSEPPKAPLLLATEPESPSQTSTFASLIGTLPEPEPGLEVRVFLDGACQDGADFLLAEVDPLDGTRFHLDFEIEENTSVTLVADAIDLAGNASPCSEALVYRHDNLAPDAPIISDSSPRSPSNKPGPVTLEGESEGLAEVMVYQAKNAEDAYCEDGEVLDGEGFVVAVTSSESGRFFAEVPILLNSYSYFFALAKDEAGNISGCSELFAFQHHNEVPDAPVLTGTEPSSPSNTSVTPTIKGEGPDYANLTVRLYATSRCREGLNEEEWEGVLLGEQALSDGRFEFSLELEANSETLLSADILDAAGNTSACSNSLSYVHDSLPPDAPILTGTDPSSPSKFGDATVFGESEGHASILLYLGENCQAARPISLQADEVGAFAYFFEANWDGVTVFSAKATDLAGNVSPCSSSLSYVHDRFPPEPPVFTDILPDIVSSTDTSPVLLGTAEEKAWVRIYRDEACQDFLGETQATAGGTGQVGDFRVELSVEANSTTDFYGTATDAAGNVSACVRGPSFTHDDQPPLPPVVEGSDPESPSIQAQPRFFGTAEAGSTVRLYAASDCERGSRLGSQLAEDGRFEIWSEALEEGENKIYGTSENLAGLVSQCEEVFVYTLDRSTPDAPVILESSPKSPSNEVIAPLLTGKATLGGLVRIYTEPNCEGLLRGEGEASIPTGEDGMGSFSIQVEIGSDEGRNRSRTYYANVTSPTGSQSPCSLGFEYIHDITRPEPPRITTSLPRSPSNTEDDPILMGQSEKNAVLVVYTDPFCLDTDAIVATGQANLEGTFQIPVDLVRESSTSYYARATDEAGNTSDCSSPGFLFTHSETLPNIPIWSKTVPASPSNTNVIPTLYGETQEATGLTVRLYHAADCQGEVKATAASVRGEFSFSGDYHAGGDVIIVPNGEAYFSADILDGAGNASDCSETLVFVHDSISPERPSILAANPESPSQDRNPILSGEADAFSQLTIYRGEHCDAEEAGQVKADALGHFSLPVLAFPDAHTYFVARATDEAGNASPCSSDGGGEPFLYIHDTTSPEAPIFTAVLPAELSKDTRQPELQGTAEEGARVLVYGSALCEEGAFLGEGTADADGRFAITVSELDENTTTRFYGRAKDAAGNESDCVMGGSFTHDNLAPLIPVVEATRPSSPSNSLSPEFLGTGEDESLLVFYSDATCMDEAGRGSVEGGRFAIEVRAIENAESTFYVVARDLAGNASDCVAVTGYENDSVPPLPPVISESLPESPSRESFQPELLGTAELGAKIQVFTNSDCEGSLRAEGTANIESATEGLGHFQVQVAILESQAVNQTRLYYANATDLAGNTSVCSLAFPFQHDSTPPLPPIWDGTLPSSPSNLMDDPILSGFSEPGSFVAVYTEPSCQDETKKVAEGEALEAADGEALGLFSVQVPLQENTLSTYYAKARDRAGNDSDCSLPLEFRHLKRNIAAPEWTGTVPRSPSNSNQRPVFSGTTELLSGLTLRLYEGESCSGSLLRTAAVTNGHFSVSGELQLNGRLVFSADLIDAAGNVSACSLPLAYESDLTPPEPPLFNLPEPLSPSQDRRPLISGTTEPRATVFILDGQICELEEASTSVEADENGHFSLYIEVEENASTAFTALSRDEAGNLSLGCSEALHYRHDQLPPLPPILLYTIPDAVSSDDSQPILAGRLQEEEVFASLRVFTEGSCEGGDYQEFELDEADVLAFYGELSVQENHESLIVAQVVDLAGNVSDCSEPLSFLHDNIPPARPEILDSEPRSPTNSSLRPLLTGHAEAGATLQLYLDDGCSAEESFLASGTVNEEGQFSIEVVVTPNATTEFFAKAVDRAGNASPCSEGFSFTHDDNVPAAPEWEGTEPSSPSQSSREPRLKGAVEAGARMEVELFSEAECAGERLAELATESGRFEFQISVDENSETHFSALVKNAAGTASACSSTLSYVHDNIAPVAPILLSFFPSSPSQEPYPELRGESEAFAEIEIFSGTGCSDLEEEVVAHAVANTDGAFRVDVPALAEGMHEFYARAIDLAGNLGPCTEEPIVYHHKTEPPAPPVLLTTVPESPSRDSWMPRIFGKVSAFEEGMKVRVYANGLCEGEDFLEADFLEAGVEGEALEFSALLRVKENQVSYIVAETIDAAFNRSQCSLPFPYEHDSLPPRAPEITGSHPESPNNQSTRPELRGQSEAFSQLFFFTDSRCLDEEQLVGTGEADENGLFFAEVEAVPQAITDFYAMAKDAAGNRSPCSSRFRYQHHTSPPEAPTWTRTEPRSPSRLSRNPILYGSASDLEGLFVRLYEHPDCAGEVIQETAVVGGQFSFLVHVLEDSSNTFSADTRDAAGNVSLSCSENLTYVHDQTPPLRPELLETEPESPSRSLTPTVFGKAEPHSLVSIFTEGNCTGSTRYQLEADEDGRFSLAIEVLGNRVTEFSALSEDRAGNFSSCSASLFYANDREAPLPPVFRELSPGPISSSDTHPVLSGELEENAFLTLYTEANCEGTALVTERFPSGIFRVSTEVEENSLTRFYATATDEAGNVSHCAIGPSYRHDNAKPAPPEIERAMPASPSRETSPLLIGSAEKDAQVSIFRDAHCESEPIGVGQAFEGHFEISVAAFYDQETLFYALAKDQAGNLSDCSSGFSYWNDISPPAAPVLESTSPSSPSNTVSDPTISGVAELGSTVRIYSGANCTSPLRGTVLASEAIGSGLARFELQVTGGQRRTNFYYATARDEAGNTSPCSDPIAFRHDDEAPRVPLILASNPPSPSNLPEMPSLLGEAEALSEVKLYKEATCKDELLLAGTAFVDEEGQFSIPVEINYNSANAFYAAAKDEAGNVSLCSDAFVYRHSNVQPNPPVLTKTVPISPSNSIRNPEVHGSTANLSGLTVRLYAHAECGGNPIDTTSSLHGEFFFPVSVEANSQQTFSADLVDEAGNVSPCSNDLLYVHDAIAPERPSINSSEPGSPSKELLTVLRGQAERGARVTVYKRQNCEGEGTEVFADLQNGVFQASLTALMDSTTYFSANARDAAGNTSLCSASFPYEHDRQPPSPPEFQSISPGEFASDTVTPTLFGMAENDALVRIYKDAACEGLVLGEGRVENQGFAIQVTVEEGSSTTFYGQSEDRAGNRSTACVKGPSFTHDNEAPLPPVITASNPVSPHQSYEPELLGSGEKAAFIRIYHDEDCSDGPYGTGYVGADGRFVISAQALGNATTTFYATAMDQAENLSACSSVPFNYRNDVEAPAAPVLTGISPMSPSSSSDNPLLSGHAETGSSIVIYSHESCEGTARGEGKANGASLGGGLSQFEISVTRPDNALRIYYARAMDQAGNLSPCSEGMPYEHDNIAPREALILGSLPGSPNNESLTPLLQVDAEEGVELEVYASPDCRGASLGGGMALSGVTEVAVNLTQHETRLYVLSRDLAGNSSCGEGFLYEYRLRVIDAPILTGTDPSSPSNQTTRPRLLGTALPGTIISVYDVEDCTGTPLSSGPNNSGTFSIQLSLLANDSTLLYASAKDDAGNVSPCSLGYEYVHDDQKPAPPVLDPTTAPASPSKTSHKALVSGQAESGTTVRIYRNAGCVDPVVGQGLAQNERFSIEATGIENGSTVFYARSTDAAGNASNCSLLGVPFSHDNLPPSSPTWTESVPESPSSLSRTPLLKGQAESNASVRLYSRSDCDEAFFLDETVANTAPSAGLAGFAFSVTVAENSDNNFYVKAVDEAQNSSLCSSALNFRHDSLAPEAPLWADSTPLSPNNHSSGNSPRLNGQGESGTVVSLYRSPDCSGSALGTTTVSDGTFTFQVSVVSNQKTSFTVKATDAAGNASLCSEVFVYEHDTLAPTISSLLSVPESPSNSVTTPILQGESEGLSRIRIYQSEGCSSQVAETYADENGHFSVTVQARSNGLRTFYARAFDPAGNQSACTSGLPYVHDDRAPSKPVILASVPLSPSMTSFNPLLSGTAEAESLVRVYSGSCGDEDAVFVAETWAQSGNAFEVSVEGKADDTVTFFVTARDAANNTSICSDGFDFTHQIESPDTPVITRSSPESPSSTNSSPTLIGAANRGYTVKIYDNEDCSGGALAEGVASSIDRFSIPVNATPNGTRTFYAMAFDAASNPSACSSGFSYTHDNVAPLAPVLVRTEPSQLPNNLTATPMVIGEAEEGATVRFYRSNDPLVRCEGGLYGQGIAGEDGFEIQVTMDSHLHYISAYATDAAGNRSECSNTLPYQYDATAPARPGRPNIVPAESNELHPVLSGTAEAQSTIRVYVDESCEGASLGEATVLEDRTYEVILDLSSRKNRTTTFYVAAEDAAGNVSECSIGRAYVHDDIPPGMPVFNVGPGGSTASPSKTQNLPITVTVRGSAEEGAMVSFFGDDSCETPFPDAPPYRATASGFQRSIPNIPDNATSIVYASATDNAGNTSACSEAPYVFVHRNIAPEVPEIIEILPVSPSQDPKPILYGKAEAQMGIRLYQSASCGGSVVLTGESDEEGNFSFDLPTFSTSSTRSYSLRAFDEVDNISACSAPKSYVFDISPPGKPSITASTPPSNNNISYKPDLEGRAERESLVELYVNSSCTGTVRGTAVADADGNFTIFEALGTENGTATFYVSAKDAAGNVSACSNVFNYIHDTLAPERPKVLSSSPLLHSTTVTQPSISGEAENGATVRIYPDANCLEAPLGEGISGSTGFSFKVNLQPNTSYRLYAKAIDKAGNASACSTTFVDYSHDDIPPLTPEILTSSPTSPNNITRLPTLSGSAEALSFVRIRANESCGSTTYGSGYADENGAFSITLTTSSANNSVTHFYVHSRDAAGNWSPCSKDSPFPYLYDATPPGTPRIIGSSPASPSRSSQSTVLQGTGESGTTVYIYQDEVCPEAGDPVASGTVADGYFNVQVSVASNSKSTFYALLEDETGNRSNCSSGFAYEHDSLAPLAPVLTETSPALPSRTNTTPSIRGYNAESNLRVVIYTDAECEEPLTGEILVTGNQFSIPVTVSPESTTVFYADARDPAGNISPCSDTSLSYTHDATPPLAPVISSISPVSPNNYEPKPTISGQAEAKATVRLYTGANCSGTIRGTATADAAGAFAVVATVSANSVSHFQAKAIDAAGNESECSNIMTYEYQLQRPGRPTLSVSPSQPQNETTTATFTGSGKAGTTVRLHRYSDCSDDALVTAPVSANGFEFSYAAEANAVSSFYVDLLDSAGNISDCSTRAVFTHDDEKPLPPVISGGSRGNISNAVNGTSFSLYGTAEKDSYLTVYAKDDCTGSILGTGGPGATAFSIPVTVQANSEQLLYVNARDAAGNISACSEEGFPYVHDTIPPQDPSLNPETLPRSPNNSNLRPKVFGFDAEAGSSISLYRDATCTSTVYGTAMVGQDGSFTIEPTRDLAQGLNNLYVRARDAANNASNCVGVVVYDYDVKPPASPSSIAFLPASPSNAEDHSTLLSGRSEGGADIKVYKNASCAGEALFSTTVDALGDFALDVLADENGSTVFYLEAIDAAGNKSACTPSPSFVHDSIAPNKPRITGGSRGAASNAYTSFNLLGTAEAGSSISVFTDEDCLGQALAHGLSASGNFSITVAVPENSTRTFYARATDPAQNASPCSDDSFTFTHDTQNPDAAVLTGTNPPSPSNSERLPSVLGQDAEAGTRVSLYRSASCGGAIIGSATVGQDGHFEVTVTSNMASGNNPLSVRLTDAAGNYSLCSNSLNYHYDISAPSYPRSLGLLPGPLSQDSHTPSLTGTAESESRVFVFQENGCTGDSLGSGLVDANNNFEIQVTVAQNTTTTLYAYAVDQAGNIGDCTPTGIAFTHDDLPPPPPIALSGNRGPISNNYATITVSGVTEELHTKVDLYTNEDCSGPSVGSHSPSNVNFAIAVTVAENSVTTFYATATDRAGNVSACSSDSFTYEYDILAPPVPRLHPETVPASPSRSDRRPSLSGYGGEPQSTVSIHKNTQCTDASFGTAVVDALGNFSVSLSANLSEGDNILYVKARDLAGNQSACSSSLPSSVFYRYDTTAPRAPTNLSISPALSRTVSSPTVSGTAEEGATIRAYALNDCTGQVFGTGQVENSGFSFVVVANANEAITFYLSATDAAGNEGACSAGLAFEHDSTPPLQPVFTGTSPSSPNRGTGTNDLAPRLLGDAELGSTVKIYEDPACEGALLEQGLAGAQGFNIRVPRINANSIHHYYATATDVAGNTSDCSTVPATYVNDIVPPQMPSIYSEPASPSSEARPLIVGYTEAFATVRLYQGTQSCSASYEVASGQSDENGYYALRADPVPENGASYFSTRAYDEAGNASVCSGGYSYQHDNSHPNTPIIQGNYEGTPSQAEEITLWGSADPGSEVFVYSSMDCQGTLYGSDLTSGTGYFEVTLTAPRNSKTTFYAIAVKGGLSSECTLDGFAFTHDDVAPTAPIFRSSFPNSPSGFMMNPTLYGEAEALSSVRIYKAGESSEGGCEGDVIAMVEADTVRQFEAAVSFDVDQENHYYAKATDKAGNASPCSQAFIYQHDSNLGSVPSEDLLLWLDAKNPDSFPGPSSSPEQGSKWFDLSPNGHHAGFSGPIPFDAQDAGGVMTFTGSNHANLGNLAYNTSSFSVFVWGRENVVHSNWAGNFVAKHINAGNSTENEWLLGAGGQYGPSPQRASIYLKGHTPYNYIASDVSDYVVGEWTFIGMTFHEGELKFYKNGELVSSTTAPLPSLTPTATPILIGSFDGSARRGKISVGALSIHNRPLSLSEIRAMYLMEKERFGH